MSYDYEETRYGFRWGPMHVERCCSDDKGGLLVRVGNKSFEEGLGKHIYIRVSPKGRVVVVEEQE